MDILISVTAKIAEHTVAPVGRQVGYLLFYHSNLKQLADQVEELENERLRIIHLIETEKRNGKEIEVDVQNWLHRVDKISDEAKQIREDSIHAKLVRCSTWLPNLRLRYQLSRKAKKMAIDVSNGQGKGKFDTVGYLPPLDGIGSTSVTRGTNEKLGSRKTMQQDILEALKDPKLSIIGVYGLGGVGKTTLMKDVAQHAKDQKLFDVVIMSHVSQSPDLERIQKEIADFLGLHFNEMSVAGRACRLCERIKKEKTILIILDDIWIRLDFEKVGIPFGDDYKGCKVLLTSRSQDVLHKMESEKEFRLEALDDEETWSLFKDMTGEVDKDPNLQPIASEVAKKCAGLPVLIVTVARALKNKGINDWKEALNQLARVNNKEIHEITSSALEFSYHQLESEEVRTLFLLCGAYVFSYNELLLYGMGLGIFKHINTVEDARDKLHKMISALKASCLLLEDRGNKSFFVKMHDIVRDVATSIAFRDHYIFTKTNGCTLNKWPTEEFLTMCPQIILIWCEIPELPERLSCPNLKLLILCPSNRFLQIPDSFFEGMKSLKALCVGGMDLDTLPTSINSLSNIQSVYFIRCNLGDISRLGNLKKIEVLCLWESSVTKLPCEIGQLSHLRLVSLSHCAIGVIPPNIMSSLTNLEELYLGDSTINWNVQNSGKQNQNASLAELRRLPNLTALEIQVQEPGNLPRELMFEKLERFKIVTGDVWEWSEEYEYSKTLKLKCHASIHLEHGIKELLKKVENLYLDELTGISNVLYQLNGEGFPLLKQLHVQNNPEMQHVINSMEWNEAHDSFPSLETMVLSNLNNLENICNGPLGVNSFSNLKVIKVKSCNQIKYLFSSSMVKGLPQLVEVEVSKCNSMKAIVYVESDARTNNGVAIDQIDICPFRSLTLQQLPTISDFYCTGSIPSTIHIPISFFSTKVEFTNLETLKLSAIKLNKIWDDYLISAANYMQNLTNLIVEDCGHLKYLFSSSTATNLQNLKRLEIRECHMMEEIIASEEGRNNGVALQEVVFPKLETIIINGMKNLKKLWQCHFQGLKMLEVKDCDKIKILFPPYMKGRFHSLETLLVRNCSAVEKIFELSPSETHVEESAAKLRNLTLIELPKLKQIWSEDPQGICCFINLQVVHVERCNSLDYLFPLSIAKGLKNLEELNVWKCGILKEIVARVDGATDGPTRFVYNRLTSLGLRRLNKLTAFYSGNYTLTCPVLKELRVFNCKKLSLFRTHHGSKLHESIQQPLFAMEEVIPNLESLTLSNKNANMIMRHQLSGHLFHKLKILRVSEYEYESDFPVYFLQDAPKLECLVIQHSSFKEVFQDKIFVDEEGQNKISTQLKSLTLWHMRKLQHICKEGSQIHSLLEVLEKLLVINCSNLKNFVPASVSFGHLIRLNVEGCNGLKNLITSSTARSLGKLETMKIKACDSLAEIVTEKGDKTKDEINFSRLAMLELTCLPTLRQFTSSMCSTNFPFLVEVVVRQCPRMQIFSEGNTSTPRLRKVRIEEDVEDRCWEGSLNGTINKMFADMVAFNGFKHLNLSDYPELKAFWCGQVQDKMFNNLKSLVVQKCDFLSDALISPNLLKVLQNLEELEVRECDTLEAVFDGKGMHDKEMMVTETSQLKKLTLSSLPNLKHIWSKDRQQILNFGNLQVVNVAHCHSLRNLFSVSLCQDLGHLEQLDIESCEIEEIVAMEEGSQEVISFNFPQLTKLRLVFVSNLKSFYPSRHTLECPSLKILNICDCHEGLQIFASDYAEFQQSHEVCEANTPFQNGLFSVEKSCPNLEELALNGKDAMMIQKAHGQEKLFEKIKLLHLQRFHETPSIFPYDFLQRFPNLEALNVRSSSFEMLVSSKATDHGTLSQINLLWLDKLHRLKFVWSEDSQTDPFGGNFESSEINRAPSPILFKNLSILRVTNCKEIIYLFTSLTAKRLVQLKTLKIENCEKIEDVVKIDEQEEAEEGITFGNLERLEFISLPSFRNFSCGKPTLIFPCLVDLVIKGCTQMEIFSSGAIRTPLLETVEVENEEKHWKGDLNTTIKQLLLEKTKASSYDSQEVYTKSLSERIDVSNPLLEPVIEIEALSSDSQEIHTKSLSNQINVSDPLLKSTMEAEASSSGSYELTPQVCQKE